MLLSEICVYCQSYILNNKLPLNFSIYTFLYFVLVFFSQIAKLAIIIHHAAAQAILRVLLHLLYNNLQYIFTKLPAVTMTFDLLRSNLLQDQLLTPCMCGVRL